MASSVAKLFLKGWRTVDAWPADAGRFAIESSPILIGEVITLLALDAEADVLANLAAVYPRQTDDLVSRAQLLVILRAIDEIFERIHPRTLVLGAPHARKEPPRWLRNAQERRIERGWYADDDGYLLIPRGPLIRKPRIEASDGAETLADRFAALSVVERGFRYQGGRAQVRPVVFTPDLAEGVALGKRAAYERIVHIPLGQAADEVTLSIESRHGANLLHSTVSASVNVPARFHAAVTAAGETDIVMAPEFMVDEAAAEAVLLAIRRTSGIAARFVVAGSGLTTSSRQGLHWNEARILSGKGRHLWSQRKLWPAVMSEDHLRSYGVPTDGIGRAEEAIAAGNELVVGDVDGLGRVIVLICQDLKLETLPMVIKELQPDWIVVPVLDRGVGCLRWTHVEANDLSGRSQARFIVGSSLSLARRIDADSTVSSLMAVGPRDGAALGETDRVWTTGDAVCGDHPEYAALTWGEGTWLQSSLNVG